MRCALLSSCWVARTCDWSSASAEVGSDAKFLASLISACASFWSDLIWLLICSSVRAAVSTFCE